MNSITVTMSINESGNLQIDADTLELGSQFDNRATKLVFVRPEPLYKAKIYVAFASSFAKQKFKPVRVFGDDIEITNVFTQGLRLTAQVLTELHGEEVRSNTLEFTLRESVHSFRPPDIEFPQPDLNDYIPGLVISDEGMRSTADLTGDAVTFAIGKEGEEDPKAVLKLTQEGVSLSGDEDLRISVNGDRILTETEVEKRLRETLNASHPVGSIFITTDPTNPETYFTGTAWELWGSGRMLLGIDPESEDLKDAEIIGGKSEITLTTDQMPAHTHRTGEVGMARFTLTPGQNPVVLCNGENQTDTGTTGRGQPVNIMPPFITAYLWKRMPDPIVEDPEPNPDEGEENGSIE